jgi:hypothetical protein
MRREHGLRVVNERLFKAGIVSDLHGRITLLRPTLYMVAGPWDRYGCSR